MGIELSEPQQPPAALNRDGARWLLEQSRGGYDRVRVRRQGLLAGKRVLVVGGGTAGYLSALALERHTGATITLVESKALGHIGVGEATVPAIVPFLHDFLQIPIGDFYEHVRPTWKLGIKFEWGRPSPYFFMAPFDWATDSVGALGSAFEHGNLNDMSLMSLLMQMDRVPVLAAEGGKVISLLRRLTPAYHFDVARLIPFLEETARRRGVAVVDGTVQGVDLNEDGSVRAVIADRRPLGCDFVVDCSGFRSVILSRVAPRAFVDYRSSLATDTALTFELPHGGRLKPYTTATTLNNGWLWNIPQRDEDHCGYVFSSAFCSEQEALAEVERRFRMRFERPRLIRFRSGRAERSWVSNVAAVGNASGFVEPLESSGLLMTTIAIRLLIDKLKHVDDWPFAAASYNTMLNERWDGLRWFLALHYKFNHASDSPFWNEARATTDYSGLRDVVGMFTSAAPLRLRDHVVARTVGQAARVVFYGLAGIDTILFGQQVPTRPLRSCEPHTEWLQRRDRARTLLKAALTAQAALLRPDIAALHGAAVMPH